MFCKDCGEKLSLRFLENEGLVPYCPNCGKYKFPLFSVAVSMTIVNRSGDKILLAKHRGADDFTFCAGYVKKGETPEKAIPRELKEETKLAALKWKYVASRYHDANDVLMLSFIVTVDENPVQLNEELEEVRWCTGDEAKELIRKNSTAEYFLNLALPELNRKK